MKWLSILIAALLAAVGLSVLLKEETGYVMLTWGEWTVETSLTLLILLLSVLFVAAYLAVRLLIHLWHIPRGTARWNEQRRKKKCQRTTMRGQMELVEGQWQAAEKHLLKHVDSSDTPLLNYLGAAQAAQQQGAIERRDHYLQLAYKDDKKAAIAVQLTQAELQMAEGKPDQALETLTYLKGIVPKHPRVLTQLAQVYKELKSWDKLKELLPVLRRRHIFSDDDYKQLEYQTFLGLLETAAARTSDEKKLKEIWNSLPREIRNNPDLIHRYTTALIEQNHADDAEAILRSTLRKRWDPRLVRLYGQVESSNPERQLSVAESWLESHPQNADLLLTLGRLALRNQLWSKARSYLESAQTASPTADACQLLAGLLEQQGEMERAVEYYREGMRLALNKPGKGISLTPSTIEPHRKTTTKRLPESEPAPLPPTT